jgi:hypothetical protein
MLESSNKEPTINDLISESRGELFELKNLHKGPNLIDLKTKHHDER